MKRVYISLILLGVSALVCAVQFIHVTSSCSELLKNIERIEEYCAENDYDSALSLCTETYRRWMDSSEVTDMFLYHDYVDEITRCMEKMKIYVMAQKDNEIFAVSAELKNRIESLRKSEIPLFENII